MAISFDVTPEFAVTKWHSQAYWAKNPRTDLPLIGMDTDGCKSTTCPVESGATQSYQWTFDVDKKFPAQTFNVKMKLTSQEKDAQDKVGQEMGGQDMVGQDKIVKDDNNFCCFIFVIKLTK